MGRPGPSRAYAARRAARAPERPVPPDGDSRASVTRSSGILLPRSRRRRPTRTAGRRGPRPRAACCRSPWPAGRWSPGAGRWPRSSSAGMSATPPLSTSHWPSARGQALVLDVVAVDPLLRVASTPAPGPRPHLDVLADRGRLRRIAQRRRSARTGGRDRRAGRARSVFAPSLPYLVS